MDATNPLGLRLPAPEVTQQEVQRVFDYLRGREWVVAREICQALTLDDRRLRKIAEWSDGTILSGPGCPGYRAFDDAARIQDADDAACRLEGQAKRMLQRAASIRRRYHAVKTIPAAS
jgi:hypothetical protein